MLLLAAVAVALVVPGTDAQPDISIRGQWIREHGGYWRSSWTLVQVAMWLLSFYLWLWAGEIQQPLLKGSIRTLVGAATLLECCGLGIMILVYPAAESQHALLVAHQWAKWLSPVLANSSYSLAGLLLVCFSPYVTTSFRIAATTTWLSGLVLSIGALTNSIAMMAIGGAIMWTHLPWICVWNDRLIANAKLTSKTENSSCLPSSDCKSAVSRSAKSAEFPIRGCNS